jgi:hypothetical protein
MYVALRVKLVEPTHIFWRNQALAHPFVYRCIIFRSTEFLERTASFIMEAQSEGRHILYHTRQLVFGIHTVQHLPVTKLLDIISFTPNLEELASDVSLGLPSSFIAILPTKCTYLRSLALHLTRDSVPGLTSIGALHNLRRLELTFREDSLWPTLSTTPWRFPFLEFLSWERPKLDALLLLRDLDYLERCTFDRMSYLKLSLPFLPHEGVLRLRSFINSHQHVDRVNIGRSIRRPEHFSQLFLISMFELSTLMRLSHRLSQRYLTSRLLCAKRAYVLNLRYQAKWKHLNARSGCSHNEE